MQGRRVIQLFFAMLFILGNVYSAFAQRKVYGTPYIQTYSAKTYNGHGQNWDLLQGDDGRMYFANKFGVMTYDGVHWDIIELSNGGTARSLAKDSDGIIYVGGIGDLGYLAPDSLGQLSFTSLVHKLPQEFSRGVPDFWQTHVTSDGVFFMTPHFLLRYHNGEFEGFEDPEKGTFNRAYSLDGKVYFLLPVTGLYTFENSELKLVPGGEKAANTNSTSSGLLSWGNDELLLVEYTGDALIFGMEGARKAVGQEFDNLKNLLSQVFVASITSIDGFGYGMNTFDRGLIITDEQFKPVFTLNKANGLSDNAVREGHVDHTGNYWAATNKGLTYIVLSSPFTKADERQGIDAGLLSAAIRNDSLFLGTTWGIKYEDGNNFTQIPNSQLETWDLDVIKGRLYASTSNFLRETDVKGNTRDVTRAEPWGLVPLGTRPGKYLLHGFNNDLILISEKNGRLVREGPISGSAGNIQRVVEDHTGFIWVSNGADTLKRLELNSTLDSVINIRSFDVSDGLPAADGNDLINFPKTAHEGVMVVGRDSYYQYYADKDTFIRYDPLHGLVPGSKFRTFEETNDGTIYTVSGGKKVRFVKEANRYVADTMSFGKINELPVQNILPLSDNSVLFLTSEGLVQYHPEWQPSQHGSFKTVLHSVTAGSQRIYGGYALAESFLENDSGLEYENNSLSFSYGTLFFEEPDRNTFSYILEGYDRDWSAWTSVTFKEYTNLPEGDYTFRVRSRNLYGVIGEEATFSFQIYAPWYRSAIAFGGYGLLGVLLIWLIVRLYTYRLIKERDRLELIVKERTKEISLQKDEIADQAAELRSSNEKLIELGQFKQDMTSMIVHDLKNPLGVIIKLGEKKVSGLARKMLNLVLNILDVQKFEETNVELNFSKGSLNALVNEALEEVQDGISENNLSITVDASEAFDIRIDIELVQRVLVNLLTNAIKYAPVNSSLHITIEEMAGKEVLFSIQDEGPGIPIEKQEIIFDRFIKEDRSTFTRVKSTGLGLTFCKIVVEAHGGKIGVESDEGKGARFWFTLPDATISQEHIEIQLKTVSDVLTDSEMMRIKEVLNDLREFKVYQSTEIENLLGTLEAKEGTGLYHLCEQLINAAYNGDEEIYQEILSKIDQ